MREGRGATTGEIPPSKAGRLPAPVKPKTMQSPSCCEISTSSTARLLHHRPTRWPAQKCYERSCNVVLRMSQGGQQWQAWPRTPPTRGSRSKDRRRTAALASKTTGGPKQPPPRANGASGWWPKAAADAPCGRRTRENVGRNYPPGRSRAARGHHVAGATLPQR